MKHCLRALALLAFASLLSHAAPLGFTVAGTFQSGAAFHGEFAMDAATYTVFFSNILTEAEPGFAATHYTSAGTGFPHVQYDPASAPNEFVVVFTTNTNVLFLWLTAPLETFAGGSVHPYPPSCGPGSCVYSSELADFSQRRIASAALTPSPEPSTFLYLGAGALLLLAGKARRR